MIGRTVIGRGRARLRPSPVSSSGFERPTLAANRTEQIAPRVLASSDSEEIYGDAVDETILRSIPLGEKNEDPTSLPRQKEKDGNEAYRTEQIAPSVLASSDSEDKYEDVVDEIFLPSVPLCFGKNNQVLPSWERRERNAPYRAVEIENWVIFVDQKEKDKVAKFLDKLFKVAGNLGILYKEPQSYIYHGGSFEITSRQIEEVVNKFDTQIIVLMIADREMKLAIRNFCFCHLGVLCHIVAPTILTRRQPFLFEDFSLHMVALLGGALWKCPLLKRNAMYCGLSRDEDIVGFVTTRDKCATKFYSQAIQITSPENRLPETAHELVESALLAFANENGDQLPNDIVIFRSKTDGIPNHLLIKDLLAMKVAWRTFRPDYLPNFLLVQCDPKVDVQSEKSYSDPTIRSYGRDQFSITMNAKMKKCHYFILWDETNFTMEEIKSLTYIFYYMNFNYPGAAGVPALLFYAEKMAALVKKIRGLPKKKLQEKLFYL